jgi:hypothetical protein
MKVYLRNRESRLYCAASNRWEVSITQALAFRSVRQAARFAIDQKMPEVEIVLRSDLLEEEVTLPLIPQWCDIGEPRAAAG